MRDTSSVLPSVETTRQESFGHIVPLLKAALLLGAGGFLLATILTLTDVLSIPLNTWWTALAQVHGHLQLYGWAGLFVISVVFYFLARTSGTPLSTPWLLRWIVIVQITSLVMRAFSEPLLVVTGNVFCRVLLVLSGVLECIALGAVTWLFALMMWGRPLLITRQTLKRISPFLGGAFAALALAAVVNLGNVVQAATGSGLVQGSGDSLNVTLGLLGFLVPVAMGVSIQSLPVYAGLERFTPPMLWSLSAAYFIGLALTFIGMSWTAYFPWLSTMSGFGMILLAAVLLTCIATFLHLIRIYKRVSGYGVQQITGERITHGPFVLLLASSYLWAVFGALLLAINGVALLVGRIPLISFDVMYHSFALGFIALLLAGVSVRLIPVFSEHKIAGSGWVYALFWIGNAATLLHIVPMLLLPVLVVWGNAGLVLYTVLFGLSGPTGLAFIVCLTVNLWPVLRVE